MSAGRKCPDPGVYYDVPHGEYLAWDAASNSRLGLLVPPSTPAHLKAYLDAPPKDKKVWKEGRILHACILEPDRYEAEYRIAGTCAGVTGKGTGCRTGCRKPGAFPVTDGHEPYEACHLHVDQFQPDDSSLLVSEADDAMARNCRDRFRSHPIASGFLNVPDARREVSIVWKQPLFDPASGEDFTVRCKARIDWYSPTFMGGVPMDLKGAREAHARGFGKQAFYNGYLRQAVFYRMGLTALDLPARTFAAVAQEKAAPYELMVHLLGDSATGPLPDPGEPAVHVAANVMSALRLWAWCRTTGEYPGYPETVNELTTAEWAWSELEHQTSQINEFLSGRAA